jgi:hypothetical protein
MAAAASMTAGMLCGGLVDDVYHHCNRHAISVGTAGRKLFDGSIASFFAQLSCSNRRQLHAPLFKGSERKKAQMQHVANIKESCSAPASGELLLRR